MTTTHPEVQVLSSVLTAIITDNAALKQQLHVAYLFAQKLASLGIPVFPVWSPSFDTEGLVCSCNTRTKDDEKCRSCKHPMHNGGHNQGTTDAGLIERWHNHSVQVNGNQPNWGVPAGKLLDGSDLCVIDLDGAEGVSAWNKLLDDAGLSAINPLGTETLKVYTSKGGVHIYLLGCIKQTTSEIAPKVDTRGNGKGYVVSPGSVHATGTVYTPSCNLDNLVLLPLDPSLKALLESKMGSGKRSVQSRTALAVNPTEMAADEVVTEGSRNTKLTSYAGSLHNLPLKDHQKRLLLLQHNQEACVPPLSDDEVHQIADSIFSYPTTAQRDMSRMVQIQRASGVVEADAAEHVETPATTPAWVNQLRRTTNRDGSPGKILNEVDNLELLLTHSAPWQGNIRYNELLLRTEVRDDSTAPWRCIDDAYRAAYRRDLGIIVQAKVSALDAKDALLLVTKNHRVHPVRSYLNELPAWDGVNRIDTLLCNYLGAADTEVNRAITRRHMVAAIARAMQPGCKVDTMVVLVGAQGIRKSTFIRELHGDAFFTDQVRLAMSSDKDNLTRMACAWGIEVPEMTGMNRTEIEGLKALLSTQVDVIRLPYAQDHIELPRQSVLWGTTNAVDGFLRDETGNRRFNAVLCTSVMNAQAILTLRADRDQIWAEAAAAYRAGERWWFDAAEEEDLTDSLANNAATFAEKDAWIDIVVPWLNERIENAKNCCTYTEAKRRATFIRNVSSFKHPDLLDALMRYLGGTHNTNMRTRLRTILEAAGWEDGTLKINGKAQKCWYVTEVNVAPETPDTDCDAG
jgi:predicted P-loop ATPase